VRHACFLDGSLLLEACPVDSNRFHRGGSKPEVFFCFWCGERVFRWIATVRGWPSQFWPLDTGERAVHFCSAAATVLNAWNRLTVRRKVGLHWFNTETAHPVINYQIGKPSKTTGPTSPYLIVWRLIRRFCYSLGLSHLIPPPYKMTDCSPLTNVPLYLVKPQGIAPSSFTNGSQKPLRIASWSDHQIFREDVWGVLERVFSDFWNSVVHGRAGVYKCMFSGLVHLRLLTGFNMVGSRRGH